MLSNLRLAAAIAAGKAASLASRALGMGGGTTLPGVVARRIAPDALCRLSAALPGGVALVGGTNGKTTTTRMLAAILAADGRQVLHNRAGANLVSGLTAAALAGSTLAGRDPSLGRGFYFRPTLLDHVSSDMRVAQEEIFGPVLAIITFDELMLATGCRPRRLCCSTPTTRLSPR